MNDGKDRLRHPTGDHRPHRARPAAAVVSGSSAPGPTLCDVDDLLLRRILTGDDPAVLVAVALAAADRPLERASALAADARARRTVAVALAYLTGDPHSSLAGDHIRLDTKPVVITNYQPMERKY